MSRTRRIGITGTGGLGMHLGREFGGVEGAEIAAIADISDENRTSAGEAFDVPEAHRYEDHETMLEEADLDGVAIATPHTLHYEQTVAALERGIDTLCEKPLCTDIDDAMDLAVRAEASDTVLMVGYQRHLDPAFKAARDALETRVGEPAYITAEITQNWLSEQEGTWRTNPDLSGGGQLYDTGSHLLDVVLWTTGLTPVAVDAQMHFHDEAERVDTHAALNVTFENGAVASISVSGDTHRTHEHLHVWGEKGGFYVDGQEWDAPELAFIDDSNDYYRPHLDRWNAGNKAEVFVDLIVNGGTPPSTARDALTVTAVTEAAYESARTGETVELDLEYEREALEQGQLQSTN
ncbi:Gfo/Idh/MocA family oxidoreductase [Natronoglomus mannanivorans]|uniref:Gfo/Idh/MocA family oxidoreductase n=1 Tax=Natronoglomus mannanivorans TaxID=2979990 RepID=A0AAP2YXA4_9EURY|nr:Gfo/Idh/MocA family oxidoreductase [Halobacteria archaeon AArc-xg1-1]